MIRRVAAVTVTLTAMIVAGALRAPSTVHIHDHGGLGPLGAVVALIMLLLAVAVLVAMFRRPAQRAVPAPRRPGKSSTT